MRAPLLLAGVLLMLPAPVTSASASSTAVPQTSAPQTSVEVTLDQSRIATLVGTRLTVTSRIANTAAEATEPLIAHLNVVSLDGSYVDLEDWSIDVSRPIPPLIPGGSTSISWDFQAVNVGTFDIYVVVLPNGVVSAGSGPLVAGPPVHVTVAGRVTLTAQGALPVVIIVPLLLTLAALALRRRARRPT